MKRREFITTTAGAAGGIVIAPLFNGVEAKPCPPPSVFSGSGSPVLTSCGGGNIPSPVVQLLSPLTQTGAPFSFGHPFRRGEIPTGRFVAANIANFQCDVKNRWLDGSVKFAVLSGSANLTANAPFALQMSSSTTAPTGTAPTLTQLRALVTNGQIVFSGGISATVDVPTVIGAAPFRDAYNSGSQMTEWHWRAPVGGDAHLEVWLFVRLYSGNQVEIELCVENGRLRVANPATKNYTVTVAYNSSQRYSGTLNHYYQSRWSRVDWYASDPQVTPAHSGPYLRATQMVPNYYWTGITAPDLDALNQTYTPLSLPNLPTVMGNAGAQPTIGLLPLADAIYVTSNGDGRAHKAVIAAGRGYGTYQTHFRDEATNLPLQFSTYPTLCVNQNGNNIGANPPSSNNAFTPQGTGTQSIGTWDFPHAPAPGYMAYLISGRRIFVDELQFVSTAHYLSYGDNARQGASFICDTRSAGTVRGAAWNLRTLAMTAAVTPDSEPLKTQFQNSWGANMAFYVGNYVTGTLNLGRFVNQLGAVLSYQTNGANSSEYNPGNGHLQMATWMQAFLGASIGYAWELEPSTDATIRGNHQSFRDFLYKHAVGLAGDDLGFNYRRGAPYTLPYTLTESSNPIVWYPDWLTLKLAFEGLNGLLALTGSGALKQSGSDSDLTAGVSSSWPEGYWGNMTPALSYAVQHGAPGAAAGLARIKSSPSWVLADACNRYPVWGIQPPT